ncbi:hypothetical protein ACFFJP_20675 [Rheinheimera tilapiae]|jgi:hypothetical protein|uniref:Uncharacterized protein n=1 Tax=Rheinheimera tilapiae TaxID=875043 RepID=A0ABV6BIN0_9GAMM
MPKLPLTAAQCGRFFVIGLGLFWLLLLTIWLIPAEQTSLLLGLKWVWLSCFGLTLTSYLLILLQRIGISLLQESDDE